MIHGTVFSFRLSILLSALFLILTVCVSVGESAATRSFKHVYEAPNQPHTQSIDELDTLLQIGTGTATATPPFFKNNRYCLSAAIYRASEIGVGGPVTSVGLFAGTARNWNASAIDTIEIWMVETSDSMIQTGATWASLSSAATLVYQSTAAPNFTAGWQSFALTAPFTYSDTSNLMVLFRSYVALTTTGSNAWRHSTDSSSYAQFLTNTVNWATVSTTALTVNDNRPNLRLTITTPLGPVSAPIPADSAINVPINVTLRWTNAHGGIGAYHYNVYCDTVNPPDTLIATGILTNNYTITANLLLNTQYFWYVTVHDTSDSITGPVWRFTTANGAAPISPTNSLVTSDSSTTSGLTIHWMDNSTDETGFPISRSSTSGLTGFTVLATAPAVADTGTRSFADTGLAVNAHYWYRVFAENAIGLSPNFATANGWTLANIPGTPTSDSVSLTTATITLDYGINPANTTFAIHDSVSDRFVQANGAIGVNTVWRTAAQWGPTLTITGLTGGTTYVFQVKARNGAATPIETAYSPSVHMVTLSAPSLPISADFSGGFPPEGWTSTSIGGSQSRWELQSGTPSWAYLDYWDIDNTGEHDYLLTPIVSTAGITSAEFDFNWGYQSSDYDDTLYVGYSLNGGNTWTYFMSRWASGGGSNELLAGDGDEYDPPSSLASAGLAQLTIPTGALNQPSVMFGLIGVNEYGQNIYVSNIQIYSLVPTAAAVGKIIRSNGDVVPGASISFGPRYSTTSDSNGNWSLLLPGGPYNRHMQVACLYPIVDQQVNLLNFPDTNRFTDTLYMPSASETPTSLEFIVDTGFTSSQTVVISNSGDWPTDIRAFISYPTDSHGKRSIGNTRSHRNLPLHLSMAEKLEIRRNRITNQRHPANPPAVAVTPHFGHTKMTAKSVSHTRHFSINELNSTGGPDSFGYRFIDSAEPNGPIYNWITPSGNATPITGLDDDNHVGPYPIGFNFSFYGTQYTQFYAGSNGRIQFSTNISSDGDYSVWPPSSFTPGVYFWNDDMIEVSGSAAYENLSNPNRLCITYTNLSFYSDQTSTISAQIILYENGQIIVQYGTQVGTQEIIGAGIVGSSVNYLTYSTSWPAPNTAVLYYVGSLFDYASVSPEQGEISPGTPIELSVTVTVPDTTQLNTDLSATLIVTTDACTTLTVPITIHVLHQDSDGVTDQALPREYKLYQNYPNPFNPTTEIRFDLKNAGMTTLTVYNEVGQEVARLASDYMPAGYHSVRFRADRMATGIYFYRIQSGNFQAVKKMVYVK